jgi:cob(I)alamin adenosyltransferase
MSKARRPARFGSISGWQVSWLAATPAPPSRIAPVAFGADFRLQLRGQLRRQTVFPLSLAFAKTILFGVVSAGLTQVNAAKDPLMDPADARHRDKMVKRKAVQDAEVAAKPIAEKGLLIVHTGAGKGKSTAAFGLLLRALGTGWRCGVVQFIKGAWETGERKAFQRFADQLTWRTMGEGFTWETQDRQRDIAAARAAWAAAEEMMADPAIRLLVLDELNVALRYDYLPLAEVVAALKARRADLHIVVTGRNAKPELIEAADLVTEMAAVKHHFAAGVKAQAGIEF